MHRLLLTDDELRLLTDALVIYRDDCKDALEDDPKGLGDHDYKKDLQLTCGILDKLS